MPSSYRWMVVVLIVAGLGLAGCSDSSAGAASKKEPPAKVEKIEGTTLSRVILTPKAIERLGLQTAPTRDAPIPRSGGALRKVIPYAALIYDARGDTWTYTNPAPMVYVRQRVIVDFIDGDLAVLLDGPLSGAAVVTVGAAELFGTETGVGK